MPNFWKFFESFRAVFVLASRKLIHAHENPKKKVKIKECAMFVFVKLRVSLDGSKITIRQRWWAWNSTNSNEICSKSSLFLTFARVHPTSWNFFTTEISWHRSNNVVSNFGDKFICFMHLQCWPPFLPECLQSVFLLYLAYLYHSPAVLDDPLIWPEDSCFVRSLEHFQSVN